MSAIECTITAYVCDSCSDVPALVGVSVDKDGQGLYVSIKDKDGNPFAGISLHPDQAEKLRESIGWALVVAHARRVASEAKAREVQP